MVDAGIDETKPFLALHLSGGTTEILLSEEGKLTLLGGVWICTPGSLSIEQA